MNIYSSYASEAVKSVWKQKRYLKDEGGWGGGVQIKSQWIIQWWCILRSTDLRPVAPT